MIKPDDMGHNVEYHVFTGGVRPMWEDSGNSGGSRIMMRIKKGSTNVFWEELLLAFVGGEFVHEHVINGVVVSTRAREDNLAIWLSAQATVEAKESIKRTLRQIWRLDEKAYFEYREHPKENGHPASNRKPRYPRNET